jgi:hypothetical protein
MAWHHPSLFYLHGSLTSMCLHYLQSAYHIKLHIDANELSLRATDMQHVAK